MFARDRCIGVDIEEKKKEGEREGEPGDNIIMIKSLLNYNESEMFSVQELGSFTVHMIDCFAHFWG